ncbi:unnamed protein product [Rhizoctonia solani]|uniref:Uncharacterized protein n=1 Tax=Rhizoctonia solani TaxID=456999 RepID=A0A8H2XWT2_9AGAM|nr:unnamed protein product [Rhizoctonia solani]
MPKSKRQSQNAYSSALVKWENAGDELSAAVSAYLQSCAVLDAFSGAPSDDAMIMASRADLSLGTRHTKIFEELFQSNVILARMRNKILSRPYSLPKAILAEIFMDAVYTPGPNDDPFPSMSEGLRRIYRRLHSLLAVCSTWRNLGITLSGLWSVIPVGDENSRHPTYSAFVLALQRSHSLTSNNNRRHLAVILSNFCASVSTAVLAQLSPFYSINIEAQFRPSTSSISDLLQRLNSSQSSGVLSELSIHQSHHEPDRAPPRLPQWNEYIGGRTNLNFNPLKRLIGSLSILRLRGVNVHWNQMAFSHKLGQIHLQSVVLGDHSKLNEFLGALVSASELRDVKLISVVALKLSAWSTQQNPQPLKISLPKLQSLLLEHLSLNVLQHVLASIPRGSHRIKVALTYQSQRTMYQPEEKNEDDYESDDGYKDGYRTLFKLLKSSKVDTLLLDAHQRESPCVNRAELHSLLKSLPSLKTLIMTSWKWDLGTILALERPDDGAFTAPETGSA